MSGFTDEQRQAFGFGESPRPGVAPLLQLDDRDLERARRDGLLLEDAEERKASEIARQHRLTADQVRAALAPGGMGLARFKEFSSVRTIDNYLAARERLRLGRGGAG